MGNGPTEDEAEIIQHDQLSQHSEDGPEVRHISLSVEELQLLVRGAGSNQIYSHL